MAKDGIEFDRFYVSSVSSDMPEESPEKLQELKRGMVYQMSLDNANRILRGCQKTNLIHFSHE